MSSSLLCVVTVTVHCWRHHLFPGSKSHPATVDGSTTAHSDWFIFIHNLWTTIVMIDLQLCAILSITGRSKPVTKTLIHQIRASTLFCRQLDNDRNKIMAYNGNDWWDTINSLHLPWHIYKPNIRRIFPPPPPSWTTFPHSPDNIYCTLRWSNKSKELRVNCF